MPEAVGPLVISHAACAGHAPENTLAGIRAALDLGADAIEIDVQPSADGAPVLMHDLTVDRTTNGTGAVAYLTLAELRALHAGGAPVPTFQEALDMTRGNALLIAEIKRPGCEDAIATIARQAGALADVMAWSFLPPALEAMRRAEPRIPACLLVSDRAAAAWSAMREQALRLGLQGVSVHHQSLTHELVRDARRAALAVFAWTADDPADIARLLALRVDGVCSNYPERVREALTRRAAPP